MTTTNIGLIEAFLADPRHVEGLSRVRAEVKTEAEACAMASALSVLADQPLNTPTLAGIRRLLEAVENPAEQGVVLAIARNVLGPLQHLGEHLLGQTDVQAAQDVLVYLVRVLVLYGADGKELFLSAFSAPHLADNAMWTMVTMLLERSPGHAWHMGILEAFGSGLPGGGLTLGLALRLSNALVPQLQGHQVRHPFDSARGAEALEAWLTSDDPDDHYLAELSLLALPYLQNQRSDTLAKVASSHPFWKIRLLAAEHAVKVGDEDAVQVLVQACEDPRYVVSAANILNALGRVSEVPESCNTPPFLAMAQVSEWLAAPNRLRQVPDTISYVGDRLLSWPPAGDERVLHIVRYSYEADKRHGQAVFGTQTVALQGVETAGLSEADLLGLYCNWELHHDGDARAPSPHDVQVGRAILAAANPGLSFDK